MIRTSSAALKALANHASTRPGLYAVVAAGVALAVGWGLDAPTFFGLSWADKGLLAVAGFVIYQQYQLNTWRQEFGDLNVWIRTTLSEVVAANTASVRDFRISQESTRLQLEELQQAVSRINGEPQSLPTKPGSALEPKHGVDGEAETRLMHHG